MTPAQLSAVLLRTARDGYGVDAGQEWVALRRAPHGRGGWATPLALRLAREAGRPAAAVARDLRERLLHVPGVRAVEISGGGFLNVEVDDAGAALVAEILARPRPPVLLEDPARDAARWADATGGDRDDPALLVQREDNPLFRVRHAHARAAAIGRAARLLGFAAEPGAAPPGTGAEKALLALLGERPPARPATWLDAVARAFADTGHGHAALPLGDEKPGAVHRARLALALATGTVLADGLHRLGISAPDHV
ncbi:DALR anticodon-binding domain-containing protein [Streptomyces sp. RFCAC02]|uniref:DALR anticodon-binding domain-containing protein n=1 Tax=Streptomyces sp. RFCAC02 TaxID=2499143 RepID=UPI00101EC621|nr:DALR anticodon-binding domain-containing protein [Streptomyces sp. RFCAC02]